MQRRDALKLGAGLAAGAALGTTGCALPGVRQVGDKLVPEDMGAFLKGWDAQLEKTASSRFVETFAAKALGKDITPEMRLELEPSENLFRGMLHTMLLTQSFRDLSDDAKFHPEVQKRMQANAESVNATVFKVTENLESMDADQRRDLRETLRKQPDLAMSLAETIDGEASRAGMTGKRRTQLRSMMTTASFRLSKNEPGTVIDQCVSKVRRASDPSREELLASQAAAQAGGEAFFRYRSSQAAGNAGFSEPAMDVPGDQTPAWVNEPGGKAMRAGLWMMGIGVVTFGMSWIIVESGAFGAVFGMTAGAVLFAVGLITLIVGAIIRLAKHK